MTTLIRVVVGILVIAHGLVHLLYLISEPKDPKFPFTLGRSWLLPDDARRPMAVVLLVVMVTAFVLLGLAVWGVPGIAGAWPVFAIIGAAASLAMLVAFWNAQLVAGIVLDVGLIALALIRPEWIGTHLG